MNPSVASLKLDLSFLPYLGDIKSLFHLVLCQGIGHQ